MICQDGNQLHTMTVKGHLVAIKGHLYKSYYISNVLIGRFKQVKIRLSAVQMQLMQQNILAGSFIHCSIQFSTSPSSLAGTLDGNHYTLYSGARL